MVYKWRIVAGESLNNFKDVAKTPRFRMANASVADAAVACIPYDPSEVLPQNAGDSAYVILVTLERCRCAVDLCAGLRHRSPSLRRCSAERW